MSGADRVEEARRALRAATSTAGVRSAIKAWGPQFHEAVGRRVATGRRPDLGIDMSLIPGPAGAGLASKVGSSFFVGITAASSASEKRFALAHEVGHVLLDAVDRSSVPLDPDTEEELCDLFAQQAVAPPAKVRDYLDRVGFPDNLTAVERFARHFRLSWRASLVVLDDCFPAHWPVAFVAASWRGHPRRSEVMGLRIDVSATDRRLFLPTDCRLATLELIELDAWARSAQAGTERSGRDTGVSLRSRTPGITAWVGSLDWTARQHLAPRSKADAMVSGVVCQLDVGELMPVHRRHRMRASAETSAAPEIPGQLHLNAH